MNDLISAFVSLFQLALFVAIVAAAIWFLVDQIRNSFRRAGESQIRKVKKPPAGEH